MIKLSFIFKIIITPLLAASSSFILYEVIHAFAYQPNTLMIRNIKISQASPYNQTNFSLLTILQAQKHLKKDFFIFKDLEARITKQYADLIRAHSFLRSFDMEIEPWIHPSYQPISKMTSSVHGHWSPIRTRQLLLGKLIQESHSESPNKADLVISASIQKQTGDIPSSATEKTKLSSPSHSQIRRIFPSKRRLKRGEETGEETLDQAQAFRDDEPNTPLISPIEKQSKDNSTIQTGTLGLSLKVKELKPAPLSVPIQKQIDKILHPVRVKPKLSHLSIHPHREVKREGDLSKEILEQVPIPLNIQFDLPLQTPDSKQLEDNLTLQTGDVAPSLKINELKPATLVVKDTPTLSPRIDPIVIGAPVVLKVSPKIPSPSTIKKGETTRPETVKIQPPSSQPMANIPKVSPPLLEVASFSSLQTVKQISHWLMVPSLLDEPHLGERLQSLDPMIRMTVLSKLIHIPPNSDYYPYWVDAEKIEANLNQTLGLWERRLQILEAQIAQRDKDHLFFSSKPSLEEVEAYYNEHCENYDQLVKNLLESTVENRDKWLKTLKENHQTYKNKKQNYTKQIQIKSKNAYEAIRSSYEDLPFKQQQTLLTNPIYRILIEGHHLVESEYQPSALKELSPNELLALRYQMQQKRHDKETQATRKRFEFYTILSESINNLFIDTESRFSENANLVPKFSEAEPFRLLAIQNRKQLKEKLHEAHIENFLEPHFLIIKKCLEDLPSDEQDALTKKTMLIKDSEQVNRFFNVAYTLIKGDYPHDREKLETIIAHDLILKELTHQELLALRYAYEKIPTTLKKQLKSSPKTKEILGKLITQTQLLFKDSSLHSDPDTHITVSNNFKAEPPFIKLAQYRVWRQKQLLYKQPDVLKQSPDSQLQINVIAELQASSAYQKRTSTLENLSAASAPQQSPVTTHTRVRIPDAPPPPPPPPLAHTGLMTPEVPPSPPSPPQTGISTPEPPSSEQKKKETIHLDISAKLREELKRKVKRVKAIPKISPQAPTIQSSQPLISLDQLVDKLVTLAHRQQTFDEKEEELSDLLKLWGKGYSEMNASKDVNSVKDKKDLLTIQVEYYNVIQQCTALLNEEKSAQTEKSIIALSNRIASLDKEIKALNRLEEKMEERLYNKALAPLRDLFVQQINDFYRDTLRKETLDNAKGGSYAIRTDFLFTTILEYDPRKIDRYEKEIKTMKIPRHPLINMALASQLSDIRLRDEAAQSNVDRIHEAAKLYESKMIHHINNLYFKAIVREQEELNSLVHGTINSSAQERLDKLKYALNLFAQSPLKFSDDLWDPTKLDQLPPCLISALYGHLTNLEEPLPPSTKERILFLRKLKTSYYQVGLPSVVKDMMEFFKDSPQLDTISNTPITQGKNAIEALNVELEDQYERLRKEGNRGVKSQAKMHQPSLSTRDMGINKDKLF